MYFDFFLILEGIPTTEFYQPTGPPPPVGFFPEMYGQIGGPDGIHVGELGLSVPANFMISHEDATAINEGKSNLKFCQDKLSIFADSRYLIDDRGFDRPQTSPVLSVTSNDENFRSQPPPNW